MPLDFDSFPPEIRNKDYNLVLVSPDFIDLNWTSVEHNPDSPGRRMVPPQDACTRGWHVEPRRYLGGRYFPNYWSPRLVFANKQVYGEARTVLYWSISSACRAAANSP